MTKDTKRKIRDAISLSFGLLFFWLYLPHLIIYLAGWKKKIIDSDITRLKKRQIHFKANNFFALLYFLHHSSYYRSLFYRRIGSTLSLLIGWWRPPCESFVIPYSTEIGEGFYFAHPYSTIVNAESIGKNFYSVIGNIYRNNCEDQERVWRSVN